MKRSTLLFLYGNGNILGSTLGLIGLALFFAGVIRPFWYLIIPGLYLIGLVFAPRARPVELRIRREPEIRELRQRLERLEEQVKGRVTQPVMERIEALRDTILAILPRLEGLDGGGRQLHLVRQTATDYLPEILETYLRLPPAYARFHEVTPGKTSRDLLLEQLDVLQTEMAAILDDLHRDDIEALRAHGDFLKSKFESGQSWL